jgi:enoyl-CoA hydratase
VAYTCFEIDVRDKVAHLRLSRPEKLNSMIREFWTELPKAVRELDAEAAARVVVISSTGKHFTAGMDLSVFQSPRPNAAEQSTRELGRMREMVRRTVLDLQDSFSALEQARMPVIAAIQGGCIGGGVDMVCACDMRYCTEDAFFCIQETNIGMTADVGTLQRIGRLIPEGFARELACTGRRLPAKRARELGFVNEVYPSHDAMLAAVMDAAREIASRSPLAVHGCKEILNYARDHTVADALHYQAAWQAGMYQPADMMESFAAKAEKREPVFDDLPKKLPYS